MNFKHVYTAAGINKMPDFETDDKLTDPDLYVPSPQLMDAVNVAIWLGKPLLLTGEPGTGKTQLAYSLARNLGLAKPERFNTRTTSIATDLFYRYDAIRHFQYNQNQKNPELSSDEIEKRFIVYNALGEAIRSNKRQIVLIDEIDKAPRDLPNDILNILEDLSFDVPEIGKSFSSEVATRPVIIFTSNSEKNLPDAFLRRCIYYHIPFPGDDDLLVIISKKTSTQHFSKEALQKTLIPHFKVVRNALKKKKPSTAELLNWLVLLERAAVNADQFPPIDAKTLATDYSMIPESSRELILKSMVVLVKTEEDRKSIRSSLGITES